MANRPAQSPIGLHWGFLFASGTLATAHCRTSHLRSMSEPGNPNTNTSSINPTDNSPPDRKQGVCIQMHCDAWKTFKSDNDIIHLQFNTHNSSPQNKKIYTTHQEQKAEQLVIVVYTPLQSNSINFWDHFISFMLHCSHSYPREIKASPYLLWVFFCLRSSRSESNASATNYWLLFFYTST